MSKEISDIKTLTVDDLSLVDNNALSAKQLDRLLSSTPAKYVKERPAKGGGKWKYVEVGYVIKVLNIMFGWDWDFEVLKDNMDLVLMGTADEVCVLGQLTVKSGGRTITKTQWGNKDVILTKKDRKPLSIGNDLKAASSDALKKCASMLGIAADIYNANDFVPVRVSKTIEEELLENLKMCDSIEMVDELIAENEELFTKNFKLRVASSERKKEINNA